MRNPAVEELNRQLLEDYRKLMTSYREKYEALGFKKGVTVRYDNNMGSNIRGLMVVEDVGAYGSGLVIHGRKIKKDGSLGCFFSMQPYLTHLSNGGPPLEEK